MSEHGLNSFRAVSERLGAHVGGVKAGLGEVPRDFEAENPKRGWDRVWQRVVGEVSGAESLLHSSINCDRRSLLGGKGGSKAHVDVSEREGSDRITLSVRANENVEEVVAGNDTKKVVAVNDTASLTEFSGGSDDLRKEVKERKDTILTNRSKSATVDDSKGQMIPVCWLKRMRKEMIHVQGDWEGWKATKVRGGRGGGGGKC
jgi:hypothetical protein